MFDNLSNKLQDTFKKLRGQAHISESNIAETMQEIKMALLDADVNYNLVNEFVSSVKEESLGKEVLRSVKPGQQVVKIINDKLIEFMGGNNEALNVDKSPSFIMMVGLHGAGKTTSSAKLANILKKQGKKVLLVAADVYRPAAIDQLEFLGKQIGVPVHSNRMLPQVELIAQEAKDKAIADKFDVVIVDTAGRHQLDSDMIHELVQVSSIIKPTESLLVADSALGQEAVNIAQHFHDAITLTGIVLTKLDGDARGGAALSIKKVTNCPIKMIGTGEQINDFEAFHPDRMASRILGMGDVVSLVEKAAEEIEEEEMERLEKRFKSNQFDFNDFLSQLAQMKKLGGLSKILKFLPGGKDLSKLNLNDKQFNQMEAVIRSMTKQERANPDLIDFSRKKRICSGSGTALQTVNDILKQFFMMKKLMKNPGMLNSMASQMGGSMGGGGGMMPQMPMGGGGFGAAKGPKSVKKKARKKTKKNNKKKK